MQIESSALNSLEKAFYMTEIDPALYDLFYEDMKIKNGQWDFEDETRNSPYHFRQSSCYGSRNALFVLKHNNIGLTNSLIREMITFV